MPPEHPIPDEVFNEMTPAESERFRSIHADLWEVAEQHPAHFSRANQNILLGASGAECLQHARLFYEAERYIEAEEIFFTASVQFEQTAEQNSDDALGVVEAHLGQALAASVTNHPGATEHVQGVFTDLCLYQVLIPDSGRYVEDSYRLCEDALKLLKMDKATAGLFMKLRGVFLEHSQGLRSDDELRTAADHLHFRAISAPASK